MLKPAICKYCGKEILWAKTYANKYMPLDVNTTVYKLNHADYIERPTKKDPCYASHFDTCTKKHTRKWKTITDKFKAKQKE